MSTANFHVDTQPALWAEYLRVAMLGVAIWECVFRLAFKNPRTDVFCRPAIVTSKLFRQSGESIEHRRVEDESGKAFRPTLSDSRGR